ncbi:opine dehydrogenase, partial [Candidatus Hakubella thermalkaliphila]
QGERD